MHFKTFFTMQVMAILVGHALWATSVLAQNRSTEAGEASITDPNQECTAYYYAPSASQLNTFPPIWTPATLLANDTAGQAKWQSIQSSIPTNIAVKGSITGNFSNFTPSYPSSDPDCWWTYDKCVTPKLAGLKPDIATIPEPRALGYGFDDGPNCSHNAFYDFLSQQQQKATMFYIGSNVMDWPLEAQRAVTDGHQICVHTWSHRYMTAFQSVNAFAELWYTMKAIKLVTGVTPKCWRPPYGDVDDRIRSIATALGLETVIWQYDSNDWQVGSTNITSQQVDTNYQSLIQNVQSGTFNSQGTIMLTHELNNYTMSEAMKFYPMLKSAFTGGLVPIAVALNQTQPYVENMQGQISPSINPSAAVSNPTTASASASATSAKGGSSAGGAIGMPAASPGLVGAIVVTLAFLGGVARVAA